MSITRQDIRELASVDNVSDAKELICTNRGLVDLGCMSEAVQLTSLNLSFNNLQSISALSSLSGLTSLNLAHNKVQLSSRVFSSLCGLVYLNVSHNNISQLAPLSSCVSLQELLLHNNKVQATDLQPLAALTNLSKLCLLGNPVAKQQHTTAYRPTVLAACPSIQVLDAVSVSDADRQAATSIPTTAWNAVPAASVSALSFTSATASPRDCLSSQLSSRSYGRRARPSQLSMPPASGKDSPQGRPRSRIQPDSTQAAPLFINQHEVLVIEAADASCAASDTGLADDLASVLDGITGQDIFSKKSSQTRHQGVTRIKELPIDSKFNSVLDALPTFDTRRLPPTYSPAKVAHGRPRHTPRASPPADASTTVYEAKYTSGARNRAVRCTRDGSLHVSWPAGDVAVSVDADYSSDPHKYQMLALYRNTGNVAVSWDSAEGGFVQYACGALCIVANTTAATGTLFSPTGDVIRKWASKPGQGTQAPVDMALDVHLGVRYCIATQTLHLYVACEGIRYKAVCGCNEPSSTWAAPTKGKASTLEPSFLGQLVCGSSAAEMREVVTRQQREAAAEDDRGGGHAQPEQLSTDPAVANLRALLASLSALGV